MANHFKGLVDRYGRPIVKAELTREQAAPTVTGVRQPYGGHPAAGLTPGRLARMLREGMEGQPERYLELAEDMEERDLHYAGVLGVRKRQVAGLDINVVAAGESAQEEADAELVREILDRDEFQDELIDVLDAVAKGFSATEIIWDTSEGQWRPQALIWRDPRFFTFDRVDPERILLRGDSGIGEELKSFGWIVHRAKAKSGLTIRGGIARAVAWTFLFKSYTLKDWAIFAEAYGQPLRVGKYGPDASDQDKEVLLNAVANIGADYSAIIPQSMLVEFVKADIAGSHELYEKRADWLDRQVSKLVLGATGAVDAPVGGGYASSKVHDGVREDIERADARQLAATLNRDLVLPLVALNHGPRKRYPRITIGRPEEQDVKALVENVARLVPLGLKVGMATMRDKIGVPEPQPDEELLGQPAAAPPEEDTPEQPDETVPPVPAPRGQQAMATLLGADDAIDQAVADLLAEAGWEQMVEPLAEDVRARLDAAATPEQMREALAEEVAAMDVARLTELLAQMMFAARLAGEVGAGLDD